MSLQGKRTHSALRAPIILGNRRSTMNAFNTRLPLKRRVKPLMIALALAVPGSAAVAASMDDVVKTRPDQNIDQQYGRDSVYAFSSDSKPLKPEQSASSDFHPFAKMKSYAAEAWHKTTGVFKHHDSTLVKSAQDESQP